MKEGKVFLTTIAIISLLGIFLLGFAEAQNAPTCLDEDGNPVDWYIVYKLPKIPYQDDLFKSGLAHIYITSANVKQNDPTAWLKPDAEDSETSDFIEAFKELFFRYIGHSRTLTRNQKLAITNIREKRDEDQIGGEDDTASQSEHYWTISEKRINDPRSLILRTLAIAYDVKRGAHLNSIFYNDAPPGAEEEDGTRSNSIRAHAKGSLLFNEVTGDSIWLSHSTPQFPPPRESNLAFGDNFLRNGQTFMCINFDLKVSGAQIINHLANMNPLVYDHSISDKMFEIIPELSNLKLTGERKRIPKPEYPTLTQTIKTRAGMDLELFSKSATFDDDMYSSFISDQLEASLYVESWLNGKGNALESSCPRNNYRTNNVRSMKLAVQDADISWSSTSDHSKWAISSDDKSGYVCIADINRMQSQFKRGGGAICLQNPSCWSLFSGLISDIEPCPVKASRDGYNTQNNETSFVNDESDSSEGTINLIKLEHSNIDGDISEKNNMSTILNSETLSQDLERLTLD